MRTLRYSTVTSRPHSSPQAQRYRISPRNKAGILEVVFFFLLTSSWVCSGTGTAWSCTFSQRHKYFNLDSPRSSLKDFLTSWWIKKVTGVWGPKTTLFDHRHQSGVRGQWRSSPRWEHVSASHDRNAGKSRKTPVDGKNLTISFRPIRR